MTRIFSEKYGRTILIQAMWRTKQNMTQVEAAPLTHIRSEISEQLDNELFEKINQQRSSTSLSYESVKILLMQIRTLVTYEID